MNKHVYLGLSISVVSKNTMYDFGGITKNQNIVKKQNCTMWIQTASLFM